MIEFHGDKKLLGILSLDSHRGMKLVHWTASHQMIESYRVVGP